MDAEVTTKVCSKCLNEKHSIDFYKHKLTKSGLRSECISCSLRKGKEYKAKNKQKIAQYTKKYYSENKEKFRDLYKEYVVKNKEKTAERHKKYRARNKGKLQYLRKKYYSANKEKAAEYAKKYYSENKNKFTGYRKKAQSELRGSYLRQIIIKSNPTLKQAQIPQSLINLKREEIKIKRLIKEMTQ